MTPWSPLGWGYRFGSRHFAEKELRDGLKAVGGKRNPEEKVWNVPYGLTRGTELEKRIFGGGRQTGAEKAVIPYGMQHPV